VSIGPVFGQWSEHVLELPARSVLEFWCGLVQQLLGGKVPVFKRSDDMHELPLRLDIAFDRRFSVDGVHRLRWRHVLSRPRFRMRELPSGILLLLLRLKRVRELRFRHVFSSLRVCPVHDVPGWCLFEHDGGVGVDGVLLLRRGAVLARRGDFVQRLRSGQLPERKRWSKLRCLFGWLLRGQRS
jgi:hypothetical protein